MNTRTQKTADLVPVLLLFLLCVLFFSEIVIRGKQLYGSDFVQYFYPIKKFVRDAVLTSHGLPFWNPYLLSGTPFIANIQASMFYPFGILYYLLSPEKAYGFSTAFHCVLGSAFMYVFMRGVSMSRAAGFLSALIFGFNGYFMAHLFAGHLSFVQTYIWIPLVFHFLRRFMNGYLVRDIAAGGLVLGIQILGGFPQLAFYTILASVLFMLLYGFPTIRMGPTPRRLALFSGMAMVLVIAFAVAGVQLLPTLEFTRMSTRAGGVNYAMATYDSLHPKELLAFLMPDIFGNAVDSTYWRSKEPWHFWETCGYVGILPLFLAFIKVKRSEVQVLRRFFVVLFLLAVFLAFGKYNPLYPVIYRLPGFSSFRIPAQVIYLYVFAIAVLSGLGLDQIVKGSYKLNKAFYLFLFGAGVVLAVFMTGLHIYSYPFFSLLIKHFAESPVTHVDIAAMYERISSTINGSVFLFSLSLLLIGFGAYVKIGRRLFAFLACVVLLVDIYSFSSQFITTYEFQAPKTKQDIVACLSKSPVSGRVVTNSHLFQANDGLKWEFPSVLGYDPLMLRRYVEFVLLSQGLPMDDHVVNLHRIHDVKARLLALLNIRQVVMDGQVEAMESDMPYAQVVPNKVTVPSTEVLAFMNSEKFDPREVVVLEGERFSEDRIAHQGKPGATSCKILRYTNEEIVIRVSTERDGYLVLSEVYYPGWQAAVNGKEVEVLCGNYIFRAIPVEAGDHEVHLSFVSWSVRIGVLLSLVGLSNCILLILPIKRSVSKGLID
ncbi:MAG: YfhO family protein [Deltaproteobacteria bacterium]